MKYFLLVFPILLMAGTGYAADIDVASAISNVRANCTGIADEFNRMKTMAGINTAVTGVGAATGVGALVVGIQKKRTDAELREIFFNILKNDSTYEVEVAKLEEKSKKLGNIRTGLLAGTAATNVAGAVIAGTNRVDKDLAFKIGACAGSVKALSNAYMQARMDKSVDESELKRVKDIIDACSDVEHIDIAKINPRATGAMALSSVGAATGIAGTIASAVANSDKNRPSATNTNKNGADTAANVMAGVSSGASLGAAIFNASEIKALKNASEIADKCEGGLK